MPIPNGTRYIIRQEGANEWYLYSRKQGEVEKMHRDTTQQGCVDYLNFFLAPNATYYDKNGNVLTPDPA